jgi:superfamily II DNA or RNA helicase
MPTPIPTLIDHKLRVSLDVLPEDALDSVIEALSIPNLAKAKAKKMDEWGWERMPDYIPLYRLVNPGDEMAEYVYIEMPRGFLEDFATGMTAFGAEVELREGRAFQKIFPLGNRINAKPWQEKQIEALLKFEQGILKAPAGSGKTVEILEAIRRIGCKSLVIVNTKDILWQWKQRAQTHLGEHFPVGQIGDGVFDVSQYLTVATAQTLHSRYDELEAQGFFDAFSFVCLDECHHATAETYNKILNRFSARYRVGVSATPDKTGDFELAKNVLGPVIHAVHPHEVDNLIRPSVVRVPTRFGFHFRGHKSRFQRSNYGEMIQALITDPERNRQIVKVVRENQGHHQLLVSKRLEHLSILEDLLLDEGFRDPILKLTGKDSNEDRDAAVLALSERPGLLLSTLADEALDIPRLDRIHLVFPQKNPGLVTQQVGRVEREHPDKLDAIIFDYADGNIGPLDKQWRTRRFEVYEPRAYKISTRKVQT